MDEQDCIKVLSKKEQEIKKACVKIWDCLEEMEIEDVENPGFHQMSFYLTVLSRVLIAIIDKCIKEKKNRRSAVIKFSETLFKHYKIGNL